jgi:DNA polymerase-3 subunit alpha
MVKRAVDLQMPAIALTDHGYMFGVPNFDLECRKYNSAAADYKQWSHDRECLQKGWELEEPPADAPDAGPHDRVHAQWERDVAIWQEMGYLQCWRDFTRRIRRLFCMGRDKSERRIH